MSIEASSLFLALAGFIIGLGAVTVIDLHGFLARNSPYWTEATIRTHKVTKLLIWIGMILATTGVTMVEWGHGWTPLTMTQAGIAFLLVLNGCFLSFWVSPMLRERERRQLAHTLLSQAWQRAIAGSFVVSFLGWWSEVALFSWYLVQ